MSSRTGPPSSTFEYIDMLDGAPEPFTSDFDAADPEARAELEGTHYWHVHRRELVLETLRPHLAPAARLLELGCGTGNVATHLNRHGVAVDYGELHEALLEAARRRAARELSGQRTRPRFVRLDMARQFPGGPYAGVLLLDVLEHLEDPLPVLRNVRERLWGQGTGLVLITVPAHPFLWSPWDEINGHHRRYTARSLRALVEEAGLAVERLTHFFFPLFFLASGVKGLRRLRGGAAERRERARQAFDSLSEGRSNAALNRVMGAVLSCERRWLRHRDLPLGTSLLCLARAAG